MTYIPFIVLGIIVLYFYRDAIFPTLTASQRAFKQVQESLRVNRLILERQEDPVLHGSYGLVFLTYTDEYDFDLFTTETFIAAAILLTEKGIKVETAEGEDLLSPQPVVGFEEIVGTGFLIHLDADLTVLAKDHVDLKSSLDTLATTRASDMGGWTPIFSMEENEHQS